MSSTSSSGVSTWARVTSGGHPITSWKYLMALSESMRATISRRMCSCGNPRVWPVSWRTTRLYSLSGVCMEKDSRFMVGWSASIDMMSVPT
nr:hypothetical protein [Nocardia seriolae]